MIAGPRKFTATRTQVCNISVMRLLLVTALCLSCATAVRPVTTVPQAIAPPRVAVDTHIHPSMNEAAKPVFVGASGSTLVDNTNSRLVNQIDVHQMQSAGLRLILASVWPPYELRPGRSALDESLHQIDLLHEFARRHPQTVVIQNTQDIEPTLKLGRIAMLPQLEGGEGIQSVDDVDRLYAAGVRCIVLMHFADSGLGGAAAGQVGKVFGIRPTGFNAQGLSELGKSVVKRMAALGMIIDVAHASDQFVKDTLDITEPLGVPVIVSHTAARALNPMERNISDDLAKRVAASGGLLGVTLYRGTIDTDEAHRLPNHVPQTCDDFVAQWKYLAGLVGPEHLVLGSDFNGFISRPHAGGQCPNGIRNTGDLNDAWTALVANGIPRGALDNMGDVFIEFLKTLDGKANPAARARAMQFKRERRTGFFE